MCGFIGVISKKDINHNQLKLSNEIQTCRGPDEIKFFEKKLNSSNQNVEFSSSFIFNRLSIQDLTATGSQPMYSEKNNTLLMFNGEIYNHNELRSLLEKEGIQFNSSSSDTEVVLNGITLFGPEFIKKLIGQFSIFFIDFKTNQFFLIRDRLGQKPLFYSLAEDEIIFGTNLKSIVSYLQKSEIDQKSLIDYIEFGVVPSPNTIFRNIKKLGPGELHIGNVQKNIYTKKTTYWNPEDYISDEIFDENYFLKLLDDSIKIRSEADVDVSFFLSGGLDSTFIARSLKDAKNIKNSFTIKFNNNKYDESDWAEKVIEKYDLKSRIVEFETSNIENEISSSILSLDEPYSDPSIVPSYIISKSISKDFKVAISGDGGDELFYGYDRTLKSINGIKLPDKLTKMMYKFYPYFFGSGGNILSRSKNLKTSYKSYLSDFKLKNYLFKNKKGHFDLEVTLLETNSYLKSCLLSDYKFFLPEMMLLKIDRTSMKNSLEVRSPYVDHRLIEYMLSTNISDYIGLSRKKFLKEILIKDFDKSFVNRKKMGFVFDVENWIYNNPEVERTVNNGEIAKKKTNVYKKLSRVKTIFNAQRLWKIYTLEKYLKSIEEIIIR